MRQRQRRMHKRVRIYLRFRGEGLSHAFSLQLVREVVGL